MNKIGFHARTMAELERVVNIEGVDLVELKPDHLKRKDNVEIYLYDGKGFTINNPVAKEINKICTGKIVQIHLPFEEKNDPSVETGLCQAERNHHKLILAKYEMFGSLSAVYRIGSVLTTHPPTFKVDGEEIFSEEEALEAGKELYAKIDRLIKDKGYKYKVAIENVLAPRTVGASHVGYKPWHIDKLIGDTSKIGITIDSGHRVLNDEMSISKLVSYGVIENVHFHSNSGKVSDKDFHDDEHVFATPKNLDHYNRYIKAFRRRGMPIVLEIARLDQFSNEELSDYVMNLKKRIEAKK